VLVALAGVGCSSPSIPHPSSPAVVEAELVASISRAFREAGVDGYHAIQIEAMGGVVTLRGPTATPVAAEQAVRVAQAVPGVALVVSRFDDAQSIPASRPERQ
jgi:osmotically-inducible protein OsmY